MERAEKLGYRLKMGIEVEFFLVKERDGQIVLLDDLDTLDQPCYDMKGLTRNYEFISTLSKSRTSSAGATTRTTTRMRTASSSRTSGTTTRW